MMQIFKKLRDRRGFTLIEVLVTAFVFTLILAGVSGVVASLLKLQRRGNGAQKVQEDSLYVLEFMAREIRVSDIVDQDDPACSRTTLTINHPVRGTVVYSLSSGQIQRQAGGVSQGLSSKDVVYNRLHFCVLGSGIDLQQTRVTILTQIASKNASVDDTVTFDLQTTVDSRDVVRELEN